MTAQPAPAPDHLTWLAGWYAAQCDGDWEHQEGVNIATLDDPGWSVSISLAGTDLESRAFQTVSVGEAGGDGAPQTRWHHCQVLYDEFRGAGGVFDLMVILGLFRAWAEGIPG